MVYVRALAADERVALRKAARREVGRVSERMRAILLSGRGYAGPRRSTLPGDETTGLLAYPCDEGCHFRGNGVVDANGDASSAGGAHQLRSLFDGLRAAEVRRPAADAPPRAVDRPLSPRARAIPRPACRSGYEGDPACQWPNGILRTGRCRLRRRRRHHVYECIFILSCQTPRSQRRAPERDLSTAGALPRPLRPRRRT